jgi:signal transduction histidine kinase
MNAQEQPGPGAPSLLVVSERPEVLSSLCASLESDGHRVLAARGTVAAQALLDDESPALLIVDQALCATEGGPLARRLRERDPTAQIVVFAASGTPPRDLFRHLGIHGYHAAGDCPEHLLVRVDAALAAHGDLAHHQLAERLKTELVAGVSHEFRTPLNVIAGYVDLLRDGTFGACAPETRPIFEKVRGNVSYLLELADEFLDLSRLESSVGSARRDLIDLVPLLRELGEWFSLLIRDRAVRFEADVPAHLPPLAAEGAKLRIVIQNLLSNAAKFTSEGSIRLAAEALPEGRVAIRVSDTGPGIAPEHHEAVFDMFRQLGSAGAWRKGVGLGLALARRFARLLGGDILLESELGRGATFTLVLPAGTISPVRTPAGHAA